MQTLLIQPNQIYKWQQQKESAECCNLPSGEYDISSDRLLRKDKEGESKTSFNFALYTLDLTCHNVSSLMLFEI